MVNAKKILIFIWVLMPCFAIAQTMSNKEQRHINMKLLNLIEQYELTASLYDDGAKYAFMQLFSDDNVLIYSDILDYKAGNQINVAEYIKMLGSKENVSIHMMNVSRSDYVREGNNWATTITFDKSIVYNDANGVLFSSPEYYKADYSLSMHCIYDKDYDRCFITAINGTINSTNAHLPETFVVINHTNDKLEKLRINGHSLEFNSFDQALATKDMILVPWNEDIRLKTDVIAHTDNYDYVDLNFKTAHLRTKLRFAYALGSVFKVRSSTALNKDKSSGLEIGADLGYNIPIGRTASMGLYLGAAYSSSRINFSMNDIKYSYRTTDASGKSYLRHYELDNITEGITYTDLAIPIYLNFDHKLVNKLFLSWNIGAKIYLNGNIKITPYHIAGQVYGDYNGEIVSSRLSDALGSIERDYTAFLYPNDYNRNMLDFSLLGGLSLSYDIFKDSMYVFMKYNYEYGLTDVHTSNNNALFDEASHQYPMVYSAHQNANIATRSFMDCVSYRRQIMWLELGLIFKF